MSESTWQARFFAQWHITWLAFAISLMLWVVNLVKVASYLAITWARDVIESILWGFPYPRSFALSVPRPAYMCRGSSSHFANCSLLKSLYTTRSGTASHVPVRDPVRDLRTLWSNLLLDLSLNPRSLMSALMSALKSAPKLRSVSGWVSPQANGWVTKGCVNCRGNASFSMSLSSAWVLKRRIWPRLRMARFELIST